MSSLFLSYARGDDEPFVERLYHDLSARGFSVWWDRVSMPGRALTFLQEIRDAITARDRLVLVVGPKAVTSDYVRAEWLDALEIGKAINPVLRLGDYDLLPDELKLLDAPDFRDDGHYAARLETLVRQLAEPVAPMGKLIAVPSLPPHFLRRKDRLRALKDAVLADLHRPVVITGTAARTGIHGMGGIGKSVLAAALARDHEVRRAFPDGVLWVGIGQQPTLVTLQRRVAQALGDPGHFDNEPQGKGKLHELLEHKAVLLVLDDVWDATHAEAFDVLGPRCRAVVTTRDAALITSLGGTPHQVQLLTEAEALALLAQWAECPEDALPPLARKVMAECGRLPLALSICGAMRRDGTSWSDIVAALREADLEFLDHPHGNILKSIKVSIDALAPDQARRFAELAVFPPDETVPEAAVATLWSHTGPMKERDSRRLLTVLERRAFVRLDREAPEVGDDSKRRVSLHDLLYDYATRLAVDRVALHQQVLDAYSQRCAAGWPSGPNDGYFFEHLRQHLIAAGRAGELADLLHELHWLEAKNEAGLIFDLMADFRDALSSLPHDDARRKIIRLIEQALRADLHFIARHSHDYPQAPFQCLWNAGWWYDSSEAAHHVPPNNDWPSEGIPWARPESERLSTLLNDWRRAKERRSADFVWVRTLRPPPTSLGANLVGVIKSYKGKITSVAITPEGQSIATGTSGGAVEAWETDTGAALSCGIGHSTEVSCLALTPDGRLLVSGSWGDELHIYIPGLDEKTYGLLLGDVSVRVWDLVTGTNLGVLFGHKDGVQSVRVTYDGRFIASGSIDRTVRVWDVKRGVELYHFEAVDWSDLDISSHDRLYVAIAFNTFPFQIWDFVANAQVATQGHVANCVRFSPDGLRIVSGSGDGTVRVWDTDSGAERACLRGHEGPVYFVAFSPDGRRIVSGSRDGTVRVWDADSGAERDCLRGVEDLVRGVAFTSDGLRGIDLSSEGTVRIWDLVSCNERNRDHSHRDSIECIAWSSDGKTVASGVGNGAVGLWNAETGVEQTWLRGHDDRVTSLSWSLDCRYLASGSWDGTVWVWDVAARMDRARLRSDGETITSVAFSPERHQILTGSLNGHLALWDIESGTKLVSRRTSDWGVESISLSPDGHRLVHGYWSGYVKVWDIEKDIISDINMSAHHGFGQYPALTSVAYSADGRQIVGMLRDGPVRIWDTATGKQIREIPGLGDVAAIAAGPDSFPWRAISREQETIIESAASGDAIAWFSVPLQNLTTHPSGRSWAGSVYNNLYLIRLEGVPDSTRPEGAS